MNISPSLRSARPHAPKHIARNEHAKSTRSPIEGSYIVVTDLSSLHSLEAQQPGLTVERVLGRVGDSAVALVQSEGPMPASQNFDQVLPNYQYQGDVYDRPVAGSVEASESAAPYPRHLEVIKAPEAWKTTQGSADVISAVTDTGIDPVHPELVASIWQNPGEIARDAIDNDGNGYVDDVIGYDMSDQDKDPFDGGSSHHTHVHGIMHAQQDGEGVTGVAPEATGMALRVAGGIKGFNSAVVVEAYLYAMNEGAKTINTSFNINGFVGDKAIESTYRTLADNDVLVFNSAGNAGEKDPRRSAFEDVVLVASTNTDQASTDERSGFSNYGSGIDVAAPGKDVMSTLPRGRTGAMSGTSMASPVAAGVDLLVRSARPDWNRAQRWAQISGTADNIDAVNPKDAGLLGGGRVNAARAVTERVAPPTLLSKGIATNKAGDSELTVRFGKVFDPASANQPESWQIIDGEGHVAQQGLSKEVRLLTNEVNFDLTDLEPGAYRLVASAEHLQDPFGQALDGNNDGKAGDDFVVPFEVS